MRKPVTVSILGSTFILLSLAIVMQQPAMAQPAAAVAAPAAQPAAKPAEVPVKAVVLFSSGVGYFEHYGTVAGSGSTELRFKTQQVNDILKSLVLEDLDGGKVSAITYPSQDPIAKTLRSFQVDITSNPSLGELLNQLRGARVKVQLAAEQAEGTILGLEKRQKPAGDKGIVEVWVLNLLTDGSLRAVELEQVQQLTLEDKALQDELHRALAALAQARDQDKKPVTINFVGDGQRRLRVGYVVETPVWKTSYRLVFGDDAAKAKKGDGILQGWAVVENQTDNDWNEVQLSLVSGRPISFIQDLYQPLYIPRPVVKPEVYASLTPQTYAGGLEKNKQVDEFAMSNAAKAPPMPAAAGAAQSFARERAARKRDDATLRQEQGGNKLEYDAAPMDATKSVASVASAAKLGELFQYTVGSVSLPRQRSAMIPIINDPLEIERLSIYNQSVLPRNPLNGARIKNTTGKHLLAGPVTVLDAGSYAGDASIDNVPPGQERLLSYGVDLQVIVDATKTRDDSAITTGKIVKGVLQLSRKNLFTQEYLAENKGDKDKTLIIEHPVRPGWELVETDKPIETTEAVYRFKGKVAAGKATKLMVKQQVVLEEVTQILPMDEGTLMVYARTGELPQAVRDVLTKALQMKQATVVTQRQLQEKRQQVQQITQEQQRIRDNMKTVDPKSQYYTRLLTKLNDQEGQIEKLQQEVEELTKKQEAQQKELEEYLNGVSVG